MIEFPENCVKARLVSLRLGEEAIEFIDPQVAVRSDGHVSLSVPALAISTITIRCRLTRKLQQEQSSCDTWRRHTINSENGSLTRREAEDHFDSVSRGLVVLELVDCRLSQRGAVRIASTILTVFTLTVATRINRSIARSL